MTCDPDKKHSNDLKMAKFLMTYGKGYNAIATTLSNYLTSKKQKTKTKTNKQQQQHAFLRKYLTVYSLTLNGDLRTTAVAKKAV